MVTGTFGRAGEIVPSIVVAARSGLLYRFWSFGQVIRCDESDVGPTFALIDEGCLLGAETTTSVRHTAELDPEVSASPPQEAWIRQLPTFAAVVGSLAK